MAELNSLAQEFLRALTRVVRSLKMYAAAHPQVAKDMQATFDTLQAMLGIADPLVMGVSEGILVVQGKPVKDDSPALKTFADMLRGKHISSFKIARGATRDEFLQMLHVLTLKPEDALVEDHLKPELLANLYNIKLNELRFAVLEEGQTVGGAGAGLADGAVEAAQVLHDAGVATREDALRVVETLFTSAKTQSTPEGVAQAFGEATGELAKLDEETASRMARERFEEVVSDQFAKKGVDELRGSLMKTVLAMPPEMRRLVFGEASDDATLDVFRLLRKLDPKVRSSALVADLVNGKLDPDQLGKLMESMGPSPGEFVKLYEMMSTQLMESGSDLESVSAAMSKLFKTLKAQGKVGAVKAVGTVLVLDPQEIEAGGYANDLEEMGFTVMRYSDGRKAYEHLRARGDVNALVLEIKVPGLSGLEVLNGLQESRRPVPVVVVTQHPGFQDAFEVASYPRLKYFTKPVDRNELRAALEEFIPQPPAQEADVPVAPAEMRRAQEIQEKLIPTEAPKVEGYDLAFYYKPALAVGGDYIDFLRLDGGRTGFVVADVSGKNITGAMVMVMFRSVFRMIAPRAPTARDAIIEVNQYVTRDMPRGMFVSAVYAVLDPALRTLTIANAGHNPPLLWTKDFGMASFLTLGGTALGLFASANYEKSIREDRIDLAPQDRIFMYTDGVVEAMDAQKNEFTEKKFLKLVNVNAEKSGADLVRGLVGEIERHRGAAEQSDDITILCLTRTA